MGGTVALVVAAGRGERFGAELPKQYLPLCGKPLLHYSLAALARRPGIDAGRAVTQPADRALYEQGRGARPARIRCAPAWRASASKSLSGF